jgi:hypothetical protein
MTLLEMTEMVVTETDPNAMAPRAAMTAATMTKRLTVIVVDAIVETLLQDIVRELLAKLLHGVILEATVVDAAAKAGIETGTTHADLGMVTTIVEDEGDPAPAHDPPAGVIAPEMTEIVGTAATALTVEMVVEERIDPPASDLAHRR